MLAWRAAFHAGNGGRNLALGYAQGFTAVEVHLFARAHLIAQWREAGTVLRVRASRMLTNGYL